MQVSYFVGIFVLSSLAYLAVPYSSTLSYKLYDFRKKNVLKIKRVI